MYNNFYQCNSNYNYFQLIFRNGGGFLYLTFDYYLSTGNPNISDIVTDLNSQLSQYLTVTYDKIKNILKFQRVYPQDVNAYYLYIKPINCSNFLGLNNKILDVYVSFVKFSYFLNNILFVYNKEYF